MGCGKQDGVGFLEGFLPGMVLSFLRVVGAALVQWRVNALLCS